jgi:hypothetical protein
MRMAACSNARPSRDWIVRLRRHASFVRSRRHGRSLLADVKTRFYNARVNLANAKAIGPQIIHPRMTNTRNQPVRNPLPIKEPTTADRTTITAMSSIRPTRNDRIARWRSRPPSAAIISIQSSHTVLSERKPLDAIMGATVPFPAVVAPTGGDCVAIGASTNHSRHAQSPSSVEKVYYGQVGSISLTLPKPVHTLVPDGLASRRRLQKCSISIGCAGSLRQS